jgi:hypothetical protein
VSRDGIEPESAKKTQRGRHGDPAHSTADGNAAAPEHAPTWDLRIVPQRFGFDKRLTQDALGSDMPPVIGTG